METIRLEPGTYRINGNLVLDLKQVLDSGIQREVDPANSHHSMIGPRYPLRQKPSVEPDH